MGMRTTFKNLVPATLLLALVLAACSSNSSGGGGGTSSSDGQVSSSSGGRSGSASVSVSVSVSVSSSGTGGEAPSSGACMGIDGLFCYQWTNIPKSVVQSYCAAPDAGGMLIHACPTAGVHGTCTLKEGGGSYEVIAYTTSCASAKQSCAAGGGGTFSGPC
jgi:hypothetical protein